MTTNADINRLAPSPTRDETANRHGHMNNETKPTQGGTRNAFKQKFSSRYLQ